MKKYTIPQLISLLGLPALTVVLGLILLVNPDIASVLIGKVLGWACVLGALVFAFRSRSGSKKSAVLAVIFAAIGLWMLIKPLSLTKILGRVLGLAFFGWGTSYALRNYREKPIPGLVAAGAVTVLGLVLFLLPMSATRLALNIAGIVIICIGVAECVDRLRGHKLLDEGDDPNIIDVEKV